jgi:hypothetical protein
MIYAKNGKDLQRCCQIRKLPFAKLFFSSISISNEGGQGLKTCIFYGICSAKQHAS